MLRKILIFLIPSLIYSNDLQWFVSTDQVTWKEVPTIPSNLNYYLEDSSIDEIFLKTNFNLPLTPPEKPMAIRLGIILDRDRVYLNNDLIGETGVWDSSKPQAYDKIRIYELPIYKLRLGESNELLLHIKKYFPDEIGPAQDRIEIGYLSELLRDFYHEEMIRLGFLIFYLAVSFYFLFLFFRRRKENDYLFFGLFTLNLIFYQFFRTQTKFILPLDFWILKKLEYLFLPTLIPLMAHFIRSFLNYPYRIHLKLLDATTVLVFLLFLWETEIIHLDYMNRIILQPLWLFYVIHSFYFLVTKILFDKSKDAVYISLGIVIIIISALIDILSSRLVWNIPRLSGYSFLVNVLFQALILANKYVRINKEVEDLNFNLEKKVEHRTKELKNSLLKIEEIKNKQDGDYFLTTLLLKPLHKNLLTSYNNHINILTIQKKKFQFKGKTIEIGGDLTMVDKLELLNEKYIFFVNADAMGKSIQGAGGALVLGVLVKSILTRQKSEFYKNRFPEKWLKDYFLDLQHAFESFEGSMFISMVSGLIHEKTGFIYYFNAEHPNMVLYNKQTKEVQFLNSHSSIRKIGIPENELNFEISTYQSQPNEILIMGTDGRDDIDISKTNDKVINEDEFLFLHSVREGEGDLNSILNKIQEKGILTDDISLLSISFPLVNQSHNENGRKNNKSLRKYYRIVTNSIQTGNLDKASSAIELAFKMDPTNPRLLSIRGRLYFLQKSWDKALESFLLAQKINPDDERSIYYAAKCLKNLNQIKEAWDMAERLRLRNPKDAQVSIFLKTLEYLDQSSINFNQNFKTAA